MISLILIDDHELLREGLGRLFEREPSFEVLGQAGGALEGLRLVEQMRPDVVTLDLGLPDLSGREVALKLLSDDSPPKVVILSSEVEPDGIQGLVQLGIHGYVSKSAPATDIVRAVKLVSSGQRYFSPDVMTLLLSGTQGGEKPTLTLRQMEVITAAAKGLTTREIAENLHVSPKTIEKYRGEIIARLEAKNLVEAIDKARKLKLID